MNTITSATQRLIGLQSCAKAVHCDGQDVEETAKLAIQLYDMLLANAMKPEVMPKKKTLPSGKPMTDEQREQIVKLITVENRIDLVPL